MKGQMNFKLDKPIPLIIAVLITAGLIWWLQSLTAAPIIPGSGAAADGELAPDVQGIHAWLNSEPLESMEDLRGKVVLVDFWTYSCINCIRTLPYLTAWDEKYRDDGLVIIGVHTPEFAFEKDVDNVKAALKKYNIQFPVALDNDYVTWRAYKNRYWPHKFLIDKNGVIRYDHIGEGAYQETELKIKQLLAETGKSVSPDTVNLDDKTPSTKNTPELYAGYSFALPRGQHLGNSDQDFQPDETVEYVPPKVIPPGQIVLAGTWHSDPEYIEAESNATIILNFQAKQAHFVAESDPEQAVTIEFNGEEKEMMVKSPQLYTAYDGEYASGVLQIRVSKGFRLNSFTFG